MSAETKAPPVFTCGLVGDWPKPGEELCGEPAVRDVDVTKAGHRSTELRLCEAHLQQMERHAFPLLKAHGWTVTATPCRERQDVATLPDTKGGTDD